MVRIPQLTKSTQLGKAISPYLSVRTDATQRRGVRVARAIERKIDRAMQSIAGAIRRKAKRSIKKSTKTKPHSFPGQPIRSGGKARIMFNTVERNYNPRTMTLIVGFKKTGFQNTGKDGARPVGGVTIPNMLEYGGSVQASRPTVLLAKRVAPKWKHNYWLMKKAEVKAKRKKQGKTAKQMPLPKKKDIKWVVIPPGNRKVKARPTMRLAFNETIKAQNLKKHFSNLRIQDPSQLEKHIF